TYDIIQVRTLFEAIKSEFDTLYNDLTIEVPRTMLKNTNLTQAQLRRLALYRGNASQKSSERENSYFVRLDVAEKSQDVSILLEQAADDHFTVLGALVKRPDLPTEVLAAMVSQQIKRYKSKPDTVNQHNLFRMIAKHPNTSASSLEQMVLIVDAQTRLLIAQRPEAMPQTLIRLYQTLDAIVQNAVLHNPNTPTKLLEQLVLKRGYATLLLFLQRFRRVRRPIQSQLEKLFAQDIEQFKLVVLHPNVSEKCLNYLIRLGEHSTEAQFRALRERSIARLELPLS
ncbi:MAG: hypothetical protein ACK41E_07210, partial [Deinococcales bacterium]